VGATVDLDHPPQDPGIALVALLPQAVADEHDAWSAGPILVLPDLAAQRRGHAEQREQVPRYDAAQQPERLLPVGEHGALRGLRGQPREGFRLPLPIEEVLI
jgi:hypothetical protein